METWRPIPKSRGQYEASSLGRIRNARTGRMLKITRFKTGDRLALHGFMAGRSYTVGQLVMMAFHPEKKGYVRHKDGNKYNNRIENLYVEEKTDED